MANIMTILSDGLTSLHTLTTKHGKGLIHALRAILRRQRMRARIAGHHVHLQLWLMQSQVLERGALKRLIEQRQWKILQKKKRDTKQAKSNAKACYQCLTDNTTMQERLTNTDWAD